MLWGGFIGASIVEQDLDVTAPHTRREITTGSKAATQPHSVLVPCYAGTTTERLFFIDTNGLHTINSLVPLVPWVRT
jgi:hypothetical protein